MQFYISVMFLGFPVIIHEEKSSSLDFEKGHFWVPAALKFVIITISLNKADRPAYSRERWAGALMYVRSLFCLSSTIKKNAGRTDGRTNRRTDRPSYRDLKSDKIKKNKTRKR